MIGFQKKKLYSLKRDIFMLNKTLFFNMCIFSWIFWIFHRWSNLLVSLTLIQVTLQKITLYPLERDSTAIPYKF